MKRGCTDNLRWRTDAAGFSLVEVLAAIVLAAIVLPVAMRGIAQAASAGSLSRKQIEAATLAEYKLNEILITEDYTAGQMDGDFEEVDEHWAGYRWKSTVTDYDSDLFKLIELVVLFEHLGMEREVKLHTVVYVGEDA